MTAPAAPPLSVIIPSRDRPDLLRGALVALRGSVRDGDEILVVESGSAQPAPVWAVARELGARLLVADRPGVSHARNTGWRAAEHDAVGFVDDDIRVSPGWAPAMAAALAAAPRAGFVAGRVDLPPGQGTLALTIKDDPVPAVYDRWARRGLGHSANLGMHRDVLVAVGGFDERLGPGTRWPAGEDPDLLDRALALGRLGHYEPRAAAQHEHWRRVREYVVLQHRYGIGSGARLAKLARCDVERARLVAVDDLWGWGLSDLAGELARRDWVRAAGSALRLAGMVRGAASGLSVPVGAGHYRPRDSSSS